MLPFCLLGCAVLALLVIGNSPGMVHRIPFDFQKMLGTQVYHFEA